MHCSRCKTTSYCSQNCQTAHWNEHKGPCKARAEVLAAVGPKKSDPSTVYLALDALKTHDSAAVTEMMSAAVLSVVFLGARDDMEGELDFKTLFALMKVLFPSTTQLKVCLVGPETGGSGGDRDAAPGVSVRQVNGMFHTVYGQLPVHFQRPHVAVLLCPGFSSDTHKAPWAPTMKLLLDNNTLSVVSGYSSDTRWTGDGALEDYLLDNRYVARMLLPKTRCRGAHLHKPSYYRNAYFMVFQGRQSDATPAAEADILRQVRIKFLTWVGAQLLDEQGNEMFGQNTLAFLRAYESGALNVPDHVTLSQLDRMALTYRP